MIEIEVKSDGYKLYIRNYKSKILEVYDCFGEEWAEAILKKEKKYKSKPQLAYLWGVIAPMVRDLLNELGWRINDKETAIEFMKNELGFTTKLINPETGEMKSEVNKSLKTASVEEVRQFTEDLIIFLSEHGIDVPYLPKTL